MSFQGTQFIYKENVLQALNSAKEIFVNVVMGFMPKFWHGNSKLDEFVDKNRAAKNYFRGDDTLQAFKR